MDSLGLFLSENELLSFAFDVWESDTFRDLIQGDHEAKFIIRHLAIREAARADVVRVLSGHDVEGNLGDFVNDDRTAMRSAITTLAKMAGGVSAGQLDIGQPFNDTLLEARSLLQADLTGPPDPNTIRPHREVTKSLHSAAYIRRHSPAHFNRPGLHWFERVGIIQALRTGFDWLNRNPTFQRSYLPESLRSAERRVFATRTEPPLLWSASPEQCRKAASPPRAKPPMTDNLSGGRKSRDDVRNNFVAESESSGT